MLQLLQKGESVTLSRSGRSCVVDELLGGGGQGEVYRVTLDGQPKALKWYFDWQATARHELSLSRLIDQGAPTGRFLWPEDLAHSKRAPGFGYLMPLRPPEYRDLNDLMIRRVSPSFRALITAGIYLTESFLKLHARGYSYADISTANLFFNPENGEVLICDNDNVCIDEQEVPTIDGTPGFTAPEVVRRESSPNSRTDLFSLAVLLFHMLHIHHPFEGKKMLKIHALDLAAKTHLYVNNPVFIFHPTNKENEALPSSQDRSGEAGANALLFWHIYPQFLKDLFVEALTHGLVPNARVRTSTWRNTLSRVHDSIFYCSSCRCENFYGRESLDAFGRFTKKCWKCNHDLVLPMRIKVGDRVCMLNQDTKLYSHHLLGESDHDFRNPVAEVTQHPSDSNIRGLRNLDNDKWSAIGSDGTVHEVLPGQAIRIEGGLKINFGRCDGFIRK
jgi:DNA-binding helix-hairpin-helix protein with protein kinase domain